MINIFTSGGFVDIMPHDSLSDNELGLRFEGAYVCHSFEYKVNSLYEFDNAVRYLKKIYSIKNINKVSYFLLNSDNLDKLSKDIQDADL